MRGLRRTPLRALVLGGTCAVMTAGAVSAGLAADAGRSGSSSRLDHGVQRPARADGLRARGRTSTKRTGIKVKVRSDDEATLANQILQEGSTSPGRRVLRREPAGAAGAREQRAARPGAGRRPWPGCRARDSSPTGDWVGVSARAAVLVYNTGKLKPARASRRRCSTSPRRSGRARSRSRRPRPTSSRSSPRSRKLRGDAAALTWLKALKQQREGATTTTS